MSINQFILIVLGVASGSIGAVFLKSGVEAVYPRTPDKIAIFFLNSLLEPKILIALILYIIPLLLWIWLLKTLPITILQPAMSLTYVLTAILAHIFLDETLSINRIIGIGFIIIGVIVISMTDA